MYVMYINACYVCNIPFACNARTFTVGSVENVCMYACTCVYAMHARYLMYDVTDVSNIHYVCKRVIHVCM